MLKLSFLKLILFHILLNTVNCGPDDDNTCFSTDIVIIKSCYSRYMKYYGFNPIPDYSDYEDALDKVRKENDWGFTGEIKICDKGNELVTCIGQSSHCVTKKYFGLIADTITTDDVIAYVVDYHQMAYRCGSGFNEFKDSFDCINANLGDCPGDPETCNQIDDYIICMENQALNKCGNEARDYICNTLEQSGAYWLDCNHMPKCSNSTKLP